jgi:hypothetical protein
MGLSLAKQSSQGVHVAQSNKQIKISPFAARNHSTSHYILFGASITSTLAVWVVLVD